MIERMTSINPEILVWARESSGTSLDEAYSKFGKDQIDGWECGSLYPTYTQLKEICEYYRKPVAVCFFPEPPILKNIPASYRTLPVELQSVFTRNIMKCIDAARVMQLNLYELHEGNNSSIAKFHNTTFTASDIRLAAKQFRNLLQAPLEEQKQIDKLEDAFEYWRGKFFSVGIYVFKDAFKDDYVSGFCFYDYEFPIIYINNSFAISRQIFTLFHEAFHLICKTSGIDIFNDTRLQKYSTGNNAQIEKFCNQFAGAFLLPDVDFDEISKTITPTDFNVAKLASLYNVSREVILRRFLDAGKISRDDYLERSEEYLMDYYRSKKRNNDGKNGGNYYNTQASYKGRHYLELAYQSYYTNKISAQQLSKYMNMKLSSVQTLASRKGWGVL